MSIDSPALPAATYLDGTGVQETDDDLAALTRVLLGVAVEPPAAEVEVDDEVQERRRAQQRRQQLLAELSFLDD